MLARRPLAPMQMGAAMIDKLKDLEIRIGDCARHASMIAGNRLWHDEYHYNMNQLIGSLWSAQQDLQQVIDDELLAKQAATVENIQ